MATQSLPVRRLALLTLALTLATPAARADTLADCRQSRDLDRRIQACSEIIASSGAATDDKAAAHRYRGSARAAAGALDAAIADLDTAVRLKPADGAALAARAEVRVARNDLEGAIADLDAAIRLGARSAGVLAARGHAHMVRGDASRAIADFTEALAVNPRSASTLNNRGLAWRRAGDLDRAIADYSAAIALNPVYALAHANRAHAREAQGRKVEAAEDFRRALQLDSSLVSARDGLTRLGAGGTIAAESARLVADGQRLVEAHCTRCHAVGAKGDSPNPKAPPFRSLHARHPLLALREPLTRAIAAPHDEMPRFVLTEAEIDTIVAYVNSQQGGR